MPLEEEIGEEIKVELLAANPAPRELNLTLAISGDLREGYRLRMYRYHHLEFETVCEGRFEVLFRCQSALDVRVPYYRLALWRVNNTFYAEIDGERVMEYYDPYAPRGAAHRRFAVGQLWNGGSAILTLQVWKRQRALVGDVLEPGRVMLWKAIARMPGMVQRSAAGAAPRRLARRSPLSGRFHSPRGGAGRLAACALSRKTKGIASAASRGVRSFSRNSSRVSSWGRYRIR